MKSILLFLIILFTACSYKHTPMIEVKEKYALVIGNSRYQEGRLENSLKDAIAIKKFLEKKGFKVTFVKNGTTKEMRRKINLFIHKLSSKSVAFVYYSGHGTQEKYKGETKNYLIPINNRRIKTLKNLDKWAISLDEILDPMLNKNQGLNIVLLDSCRTSMVRSFSRSRKKGFAPTRANGVFIAYATESGETASDSGFFRKSFIKYAKQNLEIKKIFKYVKKETQEATGQTPFVYDDKNGDFKFGEDIPSQIRTGIQIHKPNYTNKYAFYGTLPPTGGQWKSRFFKILNRSFYQIPKVGDRLKARGNVNIRSRNTTRSLHLGTIYKGSQLTVKEVIITNRKFYWIRF